MKLKPLNLEIKLDKEELSFSPWLMCYIFSERMLSTSEEVLHHSVQESKWSELTLSWVFWVVLWVRILVVVALTRLSRSIGLT